MAIERIPGVGPTNTDVANAVAGAVPTNTSIANAVAAAVPTNTSIANAVAAAVPTNTSIANAVAAAVPTNTNIANAVAAAVPTNASITNIVQTYSAGPTTFNRVAILTNTQTWNHPDGASANNARRVQVLVLGGGAGGGGGFGSVNVNTTGSGGSGGGSGYAKFAETYVTGSVSVVVGAAGNGGTGGQGFSAAPTYGTDGNNGGISSFGNIVALGGFYGAGNYNPSSGVGNGNYMGVDVGPAGNTFWQAQVSNLNARNYASRGGSGGGYAWYGNTGGVVAWNFGGGKNANTTTPTYPLTGGSGAVDSPNFGGSFGNRAHGYMYDANGLTMPAQYYDRYGHNGFNTTLSSQYASGATAHPYANLGNGINTQIRYRGEAFGSTNGALFADIQDVPMFESQFQSGGGTAGYGHQGVINANAIPGGRGLLGNGGSSGTSQTLSFNNNSSNRSAGNGGAASGYGGGGGGGSSAGATAANAYFSQGGNGGAGGAGVVVVFY